MKRILIIEDEPGMASFIEKGLASRGYTTKVVGDGASATAIASDSDFDLAILDLGLPDIDGLSVLRELRRRGERLPVLILTARDDTGDKVEGLDSGAGDYITKPFKLDELLARVRVQLREGGRSEPTVLEAGGCRWTSERGRRWRTARWSTSRPASSRCWRRSWDTRARCSRASSYWRTSGLRLRPGVECGRGVRGVSAQETWRGADRSGAWMGYRLRSGE